MSDLAALIKKRGTAKATLTKTITAVETLLQVSPIPVDQLKAKLDGLEEANHRFKQAQDEIEVTCAEPELDGHLNERGEFNDKFFMSKDKILKAIITVIPTNTRPPITNQAESSAKIQLPRINLPTFDGKYTDWVSYHDLLSALVLNNTALSKVEKLQYMKTFLRGEPLKLLQSIQTTEANFEEALKRLMDRYNNKRLIVNSHVRALLNAPVVSSDSAQGLRGLLNTVLEHLRALQALGAETEHWDFLIVPLTTEKLDGDTRRQWELSITTTEPPTFKELQDFLEIRCRALEAAPPRKPAFEQNNRNQQQTNRNQQQNNRNQQQTNRSNNNSSKGVTSFHATEL